MCGIVFEKAKGHGGTVNRTSVYAEAAIRRDVTRNFAVFTRKHLCQNLFLVNIAKFVRTPFLHQMTASYYSSININEGSISKQNLNYDTKTKAYVLI